ncbi:MAG: PspA-associated protein PspAB [Solirubrobacteraceae bacterium]
MSIRDMLTGRHSVKAPAAQDRLFALSTAYVTLQAEHETESTGVAGIVFQPLATSDFENIVRDMEQVVKATGGELGASVESRDDSYGYRWMIVRDPALEDLVVAVNGVSRALAKGRYGESVPCAVFGFRSPHDPKVYFIYTYKRGPWYPFVPGSGE